MSFKPHPNQVLDREQRALAKVAAILTTRPEQEAFNILLQRFLHQRIGHDFPSQQTIMACGYFFAPSFAPDGANVIQGEQPKRRMSREEIDEHIECQGREIDALLRAR